MMSVAFPANTLTEAQAAFTRAARVPVPAGR